MQHQSFEIERKDIGYTEIAYSDSFKLNGRRLPEELQIFLNVDKLEMGLNDGSVLGVMLERSLDGVIIGETPFKTINLDDGGDINPWAQSIVVKKGDKDENGNEILLGNQWRFHYFLSQANQNGTPSKATFRAALLVK